MQGNLYSPDGPHQIDGRNSLFFVPPPELKSASGDSFYERSKPQYESYPASTFISARAHGAAGDGLADDTAALNSLFQKIASDPSTIAFLDGGHYRVTDTVYVPAGAHIVGEALAAVILAVGPKFSNISGPHPVVMVGMPGEVGRVEISDVIVSTQGPNPGAVLIQYNLGSGPESVPSGLWDVHTRIGGFTGSLLQVANCPTTPKIDPVNPDPDCIAAHTSMHVTPEAGNLYMENCWLWVADHDIEDLNMTQITVYAGRGLLIEGSRVWLVGTSVEHHTLYQYQVVNATDIWMGQIQTETPYYQPNPPAPFPFTQRDLTYWDPDFELECSGRSFGSETKGSFPGNPPCAMAWGLRILSSQNVVVYGAGLYSFFNNYQTSCSNITSGENCQSRIFWVGSALDDAGDDWNGPLIERQLSNIQVYNLNTVGTVSMVTQKGADMAMWVENYATFASTLALFRSG